MSNLSEKIKSFPNSPGVYIFSAKSGSASGGKNKTGEVLYVGKATSLRDRVGSYFQGSSYSGRPIEKMIDEVADVEIRKTETVLEAYILEQNLIKKIQPKYNVEGKDDRSFCYVVVTKEIFPRIIILRQTELGQISNYKFPISNKIPNFKSKIPKKLEIKNSKLEIVAQAIYGPYTSKKSIEIALKILRKIFPYHAKPQKTEKGCLDWQIGLCPGPYAGKISKENYRKNIKSIRMILEGKKKSLIGKLRKEMRDYSEKNEFEVAAARRNQIFALEHMQDIALISRDRNENSEFRISNFENNSKLKIQNSKFRIEGYDISDISGKYAVGSMVVFDNSEGELKPNKKEYRKFKIKTIKSANDVGAMEEVLYRRFRNNWPRPNLILLDGGAGHLNAARRVLKKFRLGIPIIAIAKGPDRKKLDVRTFGSVPEISKNMIEQIRDESHRFAIIYHRKLRRKDFIK